MKYQHFHFLVLSSFMIFQLFDLWGFSVCHLLVCLCFLFVWGSSFGASGLPFGPFAFNLFRLVVDCAAFWLHLVCFRFPLVPLARFWHTLVPLVSLVKFNTKCALVWLTPQTGCCCPPDFFRFKFYSLRKYNCLSLNISQVRMIISNKKTYAIDNMFMSQPWITAAFP